MDLLSYINRDDINVALPSYLEYPLSFLTFYFTTEQFNEVVRYYGVPLSTVFEENEKKFEAYTGLMSLGHAVTNDGDEFFVSSNRNTVFSVSCIQCRFTYAASIRRGLRHTLSDLELCCLVSGLPASQLRKYLPLFSISSGRLSISNSDYALYHHYSLFHNKYMLDYGYSKLMDSEEES